MVAPDREHVSFPQKGSGRRYGLLLNDIVGSLSITGPRTCVAHDARRSQHQPTLPAALFAPLPLRSIDTQT